MAGITGALIGGALGVGSLVSQNNAARDANRSQTQAAASALEEERRQFDLNQANLAPTIERGNLAGEREAEFLGLRGPEAEQSALDNFSESPGQRFLRERQERSLLRNSAAIGGLGGGNVRTALQEQAFGIASTQLGQRLDRLGNVARGGSNAAANLGGINNNISQGLLNQGQAGADAALRSDAARQSGLAAIGGALTGSGGFGGSRPSTFGGAPGGSQFGSGGGALGLTRRFINPLTGR